MSPALDVQTSADLVASLKTSTTHVDRAIFPDGLKTTGQHPPLYDQVYPYSAFPKRIEGPTVWKAEDYSDNPERWVHQFSSDEIDEISSTANRFIALGLPITGITMENFPLPGLKQSLATMLRELLNGKGFILYKGFPVDQWGNHKSAVAYFGLGVYLGYPVSQNGRGHILGHVQDLGDDSTQIDKVRIYRTNARQFFHADDCDIVGLLCISRAEFGGESDVASIHHVWNILQEERPDVAELLTKPIWYFDRKGEVSQGEDPYIRAAVFYLETPDPEDPEREQRVYCKWDPYFVRSLTRFSDEGIIPALSPEQQEAIQLLEATCERVKLHMVLKVGDIQFVANSHTLHARTAYRDYAPDSGMPRRHLMRLWLAVPQSEGGWRLPYWDADEKKRGGIQVDDTTPVARLEGD
ncbi:Uu.00g069010.m01.CDS01 [Anthostomella pinea]|uniref:Uu.00g069010.m01.CDS01 n=1 Tax=Anthostomella pinea TaxID=933095 RepID=A0AAI8VNU6_9PEZI|nr:Uu.00g069010.m01.CDS01 [Anthostomella pinea]